MIVFKKILFPTDFSANADKALAHALRLADLDNGEVIVQHVVADYFDRHPHWATLFDLHELQKHMDGYVKTHMMTLLKKDSDNPRVRTVLSKGKPAEEIARLAERELVDVVVMGSAKGVVTNKVIRMTTRPVLAISANSSRIRLLFGSSRQGRQATRSRMLHSRSARISRFLVRTNMEPFTST